FEKATGARFDLRPAVEGRPSECAWAAGVDARADGTWRGRVCAGAIGRRGDTSPVDAAWLCCAFRGISGKRDAPWTTAEGLEMLSRPSEIVVKQGSSRVWGVCAGNDPAHPDPPPPWGREKSCDDLSRMARVVIHGCASGGGRGFLFRDDL